MKGTIRELVAWLKANKPLPVKARKVCVIARKQTGKPYKFGAKGPDAFDCSGLVYFCFKKVGKTLPLSSELQWKKGDPIGLHAIREGDVLFFRGASSEVPPGHCGIYLGSGLFIEAPHTGLDVRISKLAGYPGYMGARRYFK